MKTFELEEILKKIECNKKMFGRVYLAIVLPLDMKKCSQYFMAHVDTSENWEVMEAISITSLMFRMKSSLTLMDSIFIDTKVDTS